MTGGRLAAIEPVLDLLRDWAPVYRRWWDHPCRLGLADVPPWSEADDDRWARLNKIDMARLAEAARELRRVAGDLTGHHAGLAEVLSAGGMPESAARRGASLVDAAQARSTDAAALAATVDRAIDDLARLLDTLVDRVLSAAAALADPSPYPTPEAAHQDIDTADGPLAAALPPDRWRPLDALVERHASVITELRVGVDEVADRFGVDLGVAPTKTHITRPPLSPCPPSPSQPPPHPGLSNPSPPPAYPGPPPNPPPGTSGPPESSGDGPSDGWEPLPPAPGNGPLLPGTEGSRPGTDTGVHVPRLLDRPPG